MHILVLTTGYPSVYYPLDGIFYRDQAEALASAGHRTGFIAINPVSIKHIFQKKTIAYLGFTHFMQNGVDTWLYKYANAPKSPLYTIRKTLSRGKKIADNYIYQNGRPDIIHMHCFEAVELAEYIKDKHGIPYIVTEHSSRFLNGTLYPPLEVYAERAFRNSKMNIAVSKLFCKKLSEKYKVEFRYLPNVVNTDFFIPQEKVVANTFTFLNVAVLDHNKNQALLIRAFANVVEKNNQSKLVIVGDGPERKNLQNLIYELGLNSKVVITGFVDREEVKKHMQKSDVFVLSSIYETFGVVLIEAMSCGLPVISTRSLGPESIITNQRLGVLCNNDVGSMTDIMLNIQRSPAIFDHKFIRQFVVTNFSNLAISHKLEELYKSLLNR